MSFYTFFLKSLSLSLRPRSEEGCMLLSVWDQCISVVHRRWMAPPLPLTFLTVLDSGTDYPATRRMRKQSELSQLFTKKRELSRPSLSEELRMRKSLRALLWALIFLTCCLKKGTRKIERIVRENTGSKIDWKQTGGLKQGWLNCLFVSRICPKTL